MRIVAGAALAIGVLGLVPTATGTHLPGSIALGAPRILYSSDWSGTSEIYAVDPSGKAPVGQVTFGRPSSCSAPVLLLACGFTEPLPSPDGRWLLDRDGGSLWIARADWGTPRLLAKDAGSAAWSPDSRLIAYQGYDAVSFRPTLTVVGVNGRRIAAIEKREDQARRPAAVVTSRQDFCGSGGPAWSPDGRSLAYPFCGGTTVPSRLGRFRVVSVRGYELAWSPDGRRIAYVDRGTVGLASPSGTPLRTIGHGDDPAWSPDGRSLAFRGTDGLRILSLRTGKTRLLTTDTRAAGENAIGDDIALPLGLVWAPDSRSLAYLAGDLVPDNGERISSGDLRVVDLSGHSRTVVSADTKYGGRMVSLAWTRPPAGLRYRQPLPAPSTRVAADGILADGPVEFLAADGDRVAYATACNTVSTWTPKEATSTLVTGSRTLCGDGYVAGFREDIALAGDSVAWVEVCCNNYKVWDLKQQTLDTPPSTFELGGGSGDADIAGPARSGSHVDSPVGAGSLLVFSSWQSALNPSTSHYDVIQQSIVRAGAAGCPCTTLRIDPGPLIIDDVEAGRIAAHGNNAIVVLDSNGGQLAYLPVKPAAVALSGNDLVVLVPGELRDYDASNATLLHTWPLPNEPSGPDCPYGINFGCPGQDETELPLRLKDAARGLVAYALNDQIHLLRLSDGTDATVAPGARARFMNAGLVYADGSRIHLVPFGALPLR